MKRWQKWSLGLGIAAAVVGAAYLAVARWLPSDEELAVRLTAEAEERLGVKVTIGSAYWTLLPRPTVVIKDFRTQQAQPVIIGQLTAHPRAATLLDRELVLGRIAIRDAVFPRNSVRAFRGKPVAGKPGADGSLSLDQFVFNNVTWISYSGIPVVYDGEVDFDADWRPRHAELRRPGVSPPFTLTAKREGDAVRWQARIHVGGGTLHGGVQLKAAANGAMHLSGQLAPRDIELESALGTFNRKSPVSGKGSGQTVLSADGKSVGELVRSLHTRTQFSVDPATILRLDLDKAVSTLGKERDGQTALQELTGQLDTQNTEEGMRATYTGLKARSGQYSATGEVTIYRRQLEASGALYLEDGGVRIPFTVSGPVAKPRLSVPPGAFASAAVKNTGSRIIDALRRIFQGEAQQPVDPAPAAPEQN